MQNFAGTKFDLLVTKKCNFYQNFRYKDLLSQRRYHSGWFLLELFGVTKHMLLWNKLYDTYGQKVESAEFSEGVWLESQIKKKKKKKKNSFKGRVLDPLLALVCPCFRKNVIVTCKIKYFLCSSDNFLLKNVIVFIFGNQIWKWCSFKKKAIFDLVFTFFCHQGKDTQIPSARILLTWIHIFCSPYWLFNLTDFKKLWIYYVWFLFGATPGVDSYSHHFGAINK